MTKIHPLVIDPPHVRLWRMSEARHHAFRPAVDAELVVLHATKGEAQYVVDGRVLHLSAGSLLLAWAGSTHFLARDTPGFDMWVGLISDRFSIGRCDLPPVDGGGLEAEARILSPDVSSHLSALADGVEAAPSQAGWEIGAHWWLMRVWDAWQRAPEASGTALHPAVARAAEALQADPTLGAKDLGGISGLSSGRLGQIFAAEMGESLVAFRTRQKLQRVEELVGRQGMDLLNAAQEAGFGSYAQFFRAYRARNGVSPRDGLLR